MKRIALRAVEAASIVISLADAVLEELWWTLSDEEKLLFEQPKLRLEVKANGQVISGAPCERCGGSKRIERPTPHYGTEEDDYMACPGCPDCTPAAQGEERG